MTSSLVFQKAARRALALAAEPPDEAGLIDLSSEWPLGSTHESLRQAASVAIDRHLCDHYTRRPGIAPLCRAVASTLAAAGIEVGEDQVVITGSVAEARYVAVRALAPGRIVYLPQPAPGTYRAAVDFAGTSVRPFDPAWELPAAHGGLLILANPNPVSGQVYDRAVLERLAAWVTASDMVAIADESAALLRPDAPFVRFAGLPGMSNSTLTLGSFADIPGLAAWQVSWIAGPKPIFTPVRDLKQTITICTAAASQYAALAATSNADEGDALAQYVERLEAITALLERHAVPYFEPHTAAFVVADVTRLGGSAAAAAACAAAGIRVGNGDELGNPGTIRIGVPAGLEGEVLVRLDEALQQLKGRTIL